MKDKINENKKAIYYAGLLHDVGKLVERGKDKTYLDNYSREQVQQAYGEVACHKTPAHPRYSAQFIHNHVINLSQIFDSQKVKELVLLHHRPEVLLDKENYDLARILQYADWISAGEREKDITNKSNYKMTPLYSIFNHINLRDEELHLNHSMDYQMPVIQSLDLNKETLLPKKLKDIDRSKEIFEKYKNHANQFIEAMKSPINEEQLYYLLYQYMWCIPAQTISYIPDISLFDHSKTTAAIALCLYEQYLAGEMEVAKGKNSHVAHVFTNSKTNQFYLIHGELSGIQKFIFNIKKDRDEKSKGVIKELKSRSTYVTLLTKVIALFIQQELGLEEANVLMCEAGHFTILAPRCKQEQLHYLKKDIYNRLFGIHQDELYLTLEGIELSPKDMKAFPKQWNRVYEKVNATRYKKWHELMSNDYNKIFNLSEEIVKAAQDADDYTNIVSQVKSCKYMQVTYSKESCNSTHKGWQKQLQAFNSYIQFHKHLPKNTSSDSKSYCLNKVTGFHEKVDGFHFDMLNLTTDSQQNIISFDEYQDPRLAVLKLDLDNLGVIFAKGLKNEVIEKSNSSEVKDLKTISRVSTLSRMLSLFFRGYINTMIGELNQGENIYVVYSGGDDTLLIGDCYVVVNFALKFYDQFRKFTCNNEDITLSAAIEIFTPKQPMSVIVSRAEEGLEKAKHYIKAGESMPSKDKVSILGEVFTWDEYKELLDFYSHLVKMLKEKKLSKSCLHKIQGHMYKIKTIWNGQRADMVKFWKLVYDLRDIEEKYQEYILEKYRKWIFGHAIGDKGNPINAKSIIFVASRLAELELRRD